MWQFMSDSPWLAFFLAWLAAWTIASAFSSIGRAIGGGSRKQIRSGANKLASGGEK